MNIVDKPMLVDIVAGARPNFMKIAPIIRAIEQRPSSDRIKYRLIHTGQHYDAKMSDNIWEDLELPPADVNFGVGSGSHAEQTAEIMICYEKLIAEQIPQLCLVVGDINSTMACAISASKCGVPVAHVEGGIRSGDWAMPEEINRIVTDSISSWFYITGEAANQNLLSSGVDKNKIIFVGNTMIDTLLHTQSRFKQPEVWDDEKLKKGGYIVMTMHRPGNVDDRESMVEMLERISKTASTKLIFPMHPRTSAVLKDSGREFPNIVFVPPLRYLEFNYLVKNALGVITDSGGITEEATIMGIPCITLRDSTERPETVSIGTNVLVGDDTELLNQYLLAMCRKEWKTGGIPEKWDGKAATRIVDHLVSIPRK